MQRVRAFKIESHDEVESLRVLLAHYGQPFPHQLAVRFPHVVKRILSLWQSPDKARTYFKTLLAKENGTSQGFPLDVYQEIFVLSSFYDKQNSPLKDRHDIWAGFAI
jgi:hypothetical protein